MKRIKLSESTASSSAADTAPPPPAAVAGTSSADAITMEDARVLMLNAKPQVAKHLHEDFVGTGSTRYVDRVLDVIFDPIRRTEMVEIVEWCRVLIAGRRTPDEFTNLVRKFDDATSCGLVWSPFYVAFRCRTCKLAQCMSLCADCFRNGNHEKHNFNMFMSASGGACDCGDSTVMKPSGFCHNHNGEKRLNMEEVPEDLMCMAEIMMPRMFVWLVQMLREISETENASEIEVFATMLIEFTSLGKMMKGVMTRALTNKQTYQLLNHCPSQQPQYVQYLNESKRLYQQAVLEFALPEPPDEFKTCKALQKYLTHASFLEELVFWIFKYQFPQTIVCLFMNLLTESDYKEQFASAFVLHYGRAPIILKSVSQPEEVGNRLMHISIQIFSNESLALLMNKRHNLLQIMVMNLKYVLSEAYIVDDNSPIPYEVVDCSSKIFEYCWPLFSDFNNILSQQKLAFSFMSDELLFNTWFSIICALQGMNRHVKELYEYVQIEPQAYNAAFSCEAEAVATPIWALISHLKDPSTLEYTKKVLRTTLTALLHWFSCVEHNGPEQIDFNKISFHYPLHRMFSIFLYQALTKQNLDVHEILPTSGEQNHILVVHLLKLAVVRYEIINRVWLRNGIHMQAQAIMYLHFSFSYSMVDPDYFLMQVLVARLDPNFFMNLSIKRFRLSRWANQMRHQDGGNPQEGEETESVSLENFLTFLATLTCVRIPLGPTTLETDKLEMATLLFISNKTHSELLDAMPDHCKCLNSDEFDALLNTVADKRPAYIDQGTTHADTYCPKDSAWEKYYNPLFTQLRCIQVAPNKDPALDHFFHYYTNKHGINPKENCTLWPPYRAPKEASLHPSLEDPRRVLHSRTFHAFCFMVLQNALRAKEKALDRALSLIIFLLRMAVVTTSLDDKTEDADPRKVKQPQTKRDVVDTDLSLWYDSDCVLDNLRTEIGCVKIETSVLSSNDTIQVESTAEDDESSAVPNTSSLEDPLKDSQGGGNVHNIVGNFASQVKSEVPLLPVKSTKVSVIELNESILSLLVKVHLKLKNSIDSHCAFDNGESSSSSSSNSNNSEDNTERKEYVVEPAKAVDQLLKAICDLDVGSVQYIQDIRSQLKPTTCPTELENIREKNEIEKEKRRQIVRERQRKIMAQMASQQNKFMSALKSENEEKLEPTPEEETNGRTCAVCNLHDDSKILGVPVYIHGTSHFSLQRRHNDGALLPTSDNEWCVFRADETLHEYYARRIQQFKQHYAYGSYMLGINSGWSHGIFIETCGHEIHIECLEGYKTAFQELNQPSLTQITLIREPYEYFCTTCRHFSNGILPREYGWVKSQPSVQPQNLPNFNVIVLNLRNEFANINYEPSTYILPSVMHIMEHFASFLSILNWENEEIDFENMFLFSTSLVRTNIEDEMISMGGKFKSMTKEERSVKKPNCLTSLFNYYSLNAKLFARWPVEAVFQDLAGFQKQPTMESDLVPLLLQDPISVLLNYVMLLPIPVNKAYFTTIIKLSFNLLYYQVILQIYCHLDVQEREKLSGEDMLENPQNSLQALKLVQSILDTEKIDLKDVIASSSALQSDTTQFTITDVEKQIQSLCLPFLRFAVMLKHVVYNQALPEIIPLVDSEFIKLVYYLELVTTNMYESRFNSTVALHLPSHGNNRYLPHLWFSQLQHLFAKDQHVFKSLVSDQHINWNVPGLLKLPNEYYKFFDYYYKKRCNKCQCMPAHEGVCLICGKLVCMQAVTDGEDGTLLMGNEFRHAEECGAGTCIYMGVTSTCVYVVHIDRFCEWGSLYLDAHGEEDHDLKRGKPLYLCHDRYKLLEKQWLNHQLPHLTTKNWKWYDNKPITL